MEIKTGHTGLDRLKWIVNNVASVLGENSPWERIILGYCSSLIRSNEEAEYMRLLDIVSTAADEVMDERDFVLNAILLRAFQTSLSYGISVPNMVPSDRPEMVELAEKLLESPNGRLTLIPLSIEGISRFKQITTNRNLGKKNDQVYWGKPQKPTNVKENKPMKDNKLMEWKDYVMDRRNHRLTKPIKGANIGRVNDVNEPKNKLRNRIVKKISSGESFDFPRPDEFKPLINYGTPIPSEKCGMGVSIRQIALRAETPDWYAKCFKRCTNVESLLTYATDALNDGSTAYTADALLTNITNMVNTILTNVMLKDFTITNIEEDWYELPNHLDNKEIVYLRKAISRFHKAIIPEEDLISNKMQAVIQKGVLDFLDGMAGEDGEIGLGGYLRLDPYIGVKLNDEDAGTALFEDTYLVISSLHHKNLLAVIKAVMDLSGCNSCTLYTRASEYSIIEAMNYNDNPTTTYLMRRVTPSVD